MPKMSKIQSAFTTGEVSKQVYGRVDKPQYEAALQYCQNYLPIIQGPLIRRPGTKFVSYVKDPKKLPSLIPFQFSITQNYMIEAGDKYFRFFQNEGQVITSTTTFSVAGIYGQAGNAGADGFSSTPFNFTSLRATALPNGNEVVYSSSVIASGSILELPTPYAITDVPDLKWVQKQDTLYLTHPAYQPMKLVRTGLNTWDLKTVIFQDGPYLPLNSYLSIADNANVSLNVAANPLNNDLIVQTLPVYQITSLGNPTTGTVLITTNPSPTTVAVGDRVFISGVQGTVELNSCTFGQPYTNSSVNSAYWSVVSIGTASSFTVAATLINPMIASTGTVRPALLQLVATSSGQTCNDLSVGSSFVAQRGLRNIALYGSSSVKFWGHIYKADNASQFYVTQGLGQRMTLATCSVWALGTYSLITGFPSATCFHQDRLVFNGPPYFPQELDASMTSIYEQFSASTSSSQVNANNALQFSLNSQDLNSIRWMKSNSQGLLAGAANGEWAVAPSSQGASLTPTNITANQVTAFGSADADAILVGNAALYIQRAQRKVRELLYYWQVGNFKSNNISELSQHITAPAITQIVNQKEPHAFVWGLRQDGVLLSLTYNRDEITLQAMAGWARHILGGRSDTAGTQPIVNSIGVIPSGDTTFDELWMVTKRYTNGSTVGSIEYLTKPFDDYQPQESSYYLDFGATYNSSILVTGITNAFPCVITSPNHGLSNSSVVRFYNTVGMNISTIDVNGNVSSSNQLNYQTFVVASTTTNNFYIQDFLGHFINTNSSSVYVGSAVINKLVTSVSGLGWLAGEQVSVVADGGIHINTSVTSAGVLNLAYPAAIVSVGYSYNSDAQMLRTHEGSAQGTSIGSTRRVARVAFMLHNVGDFSYGPTFKRLIPAEFYTANVDSDDKAAPLFDGIIRDGIESDYGFDDTICFRQSSGLPGLVQCVVRFLEENDV